MMAFLSVPVSRDVARIDIPSNSILRHMMAWSAGNRLSPCGLAWGLVTVLPQSRQRYRWTPMGSL
jgi:hypothetical protein